MIPFQQILDTTRLAGEVCCPGDKYWITTFKSFLPCNPIAGFPETDTGGFLPFGPKMRIDPEDGSYHFFTGSTDYSMQQTDASTIFGIGAVALNRNGERLAQRHYLPPLDETYTDRCGHLVEGWNSPTDYFTKGGRVITDMCMGRWPCTRAGNGRLCGCHISGKSTANCWCPGKTYSPGQNSFQHTGWQSYVAGSENWCCTNEYIGANTHIKKGDLPTYSGVWGCARPGVGMNDGRFLSTVINGSTTVCNGAFGWQAGTILWGDESNPHTLKYGYYGAYCRCCCCRLNTRLWASSYELHPEKINEAHTTNCGVNCNICVSTLTWDLPQPCGFVTSGNVLPINTYTTIAKKPFDIADDGDGIYVAFVSNQKASFNSSTTYGLSPMFCIIPDVCVQVNNCPKYQRPSGIITKYDLPSWDGTSTGHCWDWSGKTWYMHNDEITGKCSHLSVKDIYFRDNKIIVKPITYAGAQECFCCYNGATAHPTVIFCECNCNVRYLSFTSLSTNSPVVGDMIYTTRGTWVTATPTYNASWTQNTACSAPAKAYGAITIAEWNEDWTSCLGAVDVCNISTAANGYVNGGGSLVGRRNYCCDYAAYPDFHLDYDPIDDSIIFSYSNLGSCCCYSNQDAGQVGITVMKLPSEIGLVCDWAKKRLELYPCNNCCSTSCAICGTCGTAFACFWPGVNGINLDNHMIWCGGFGVVTGVGYPVCQSSILAAHHQGAHCQIVWVNPSNNPLVSVTCVTMACCQFDPDCWFRGCSSGWAVGTTPGHTCTSWWNPNNTCVNCQMHTICEIISTTQCTSCFTAPACRGFGGGPGNLICGGGTNPREARAYNQGNCQFMQSYSFCPAGTVYNVGGAYHKNNLPICDYS